MTQTPPPSSGPNSDGADPDRAFWDIERKRDEDRADTEHTLDNTRWDTQLKREQDRADTQKGLENTRWDTNLKRDLDRADAEQGLINARWDTQVKRHDDRADTQKGLDNARWDTQVKRDQDRDDAQRALDNARRDTELALEKTRWDTDHKRHDDRVDTALALKNAREDTTLAAETALFEAVHAGYIAVAQSSLDRALSRATYVTTSAGAIVTLYTGLLGLRFSTSKGPELPARAVAPGMFLAGAVVFSVFYMAFLRRRTAVTELLPSGLGGNVAQARLEAFLEWVTAGVIARAWSLRLAVVSLALGLALLPIGFVQLSTTTAQNLIIGAIGILGLCLLIEMGVAISVKVRRAGPFPAPPTLPPAPANPQSQPPTTIANQPAPDPPLNPPDSPTAEAADNPPEGPPTKAEDPPPILPPIAGEDPPRGLPDVAPAVSPASPPATMPELAKPPRPPAPPGGAQGGNSLLPPGPEADFEGGPSIGCDGSD